MERDAIGVVRRGKRVFVAADNETDLTLLAELLEDGGCEVALARTGAQALEVLAEREFDLLVVDLAMPDIDGATILQAYRFGKLNAPPALLLSADPANAQAKLRATGAVGVIDKNAISIETMRELAGIDAAEPSAAPPATPPAVPAAAAASRARAPAAGSPAGRPPRLAVVAPRFIDRAVIDGLQSFSSNPDFVPVLLAVAAEDIARIGGDLVQASDRREFERLRDLAHALKGVAASVGAARLAALAGALSEAVHADARDGMQRLAGKIAGDAQTSAAMLLDIAAELREQPAAQANEQR